jgi:hypothetical protein
MDKRIKITTVNCFPDFGIGIEIMPGKIFFVEVLFIVGFHLISITIDRIRRK